MKNQRQRPYDALDALQRLSKRFGGFDQVPLPDELENALPLYKDPLDKKAVECIISSFGRKNEEA